MEKNGETNRAESEDGPIKPWASLLNREYSLIWISTLVSSMATQMRYVTNMYQVYDLSGSSFQLGLTGFFQALPFIVFGLFAGVLADVFDRKKLLTITQLLQLLPAIALAVLTTTGSIKVWHIYVLSLVTSSVQVFGTPARWAIIPSLVPQSQLMNALTLNITTHQGSLLLSPVIAGLLIDLIGLEVTYLLDALLFIPAIAAVLMMRAPQKPEGSRPSISLRSVVEGFKFIWVERIILSLFLLDFGATLVGYYRPILPVFANDVFDVGATGLGVLYAAPAIGAMLGSAFLLLAGDVKRKGALVVVSALFFGGSLALLGVTRWFWLGLVAVGVLGFTDAISVTIRRTVVQLLSPDAMRGRASSLITVFAQSTNALGALIAGAA
ncbi:MAG: MFS transporter, partial [Candidatus Binatia bacterium]